MNSRIFFLILKLLEVYLESQNKYRTWAILFVYVNEDKNYTLTFIPRIEFEITFPFEQY